MSAEDQKNYLKNNSELEQTLIHQRIKNDADKTAKILTQAVNLNEEKISDVKKLEKNEAKVASAEALKSGASTLKKSEWDDAEIPKPGSIKMAEWKSNKQNAEGKSSAPEQQAKFTV